MGFNGKQQSHSVIGFELVKTPNALDTYAYPCNTLIPSNGSFANFTNVGNCSCASCDQACPAPPVDASIGFFDGFDGVLVAIVYGVLVVFSILFTLIKNKFMNGDDSNADEDESPADHTYGNVDDSQNMNLSGGKMRGGAGKINQSEISSFANNSQIVANPQSALLLSGG